MSKAPQVFVSSDLRNALKEANQISEDLIHQFVGKLTLERVQTVAARFVLLVEVAEGLIRNELEAEYLHILAVSTRQLDDGESNAFIEVILAAVNQGEEGLRALIQTINRARHLITNYPHNESSESEMTDINRLRVAVQEERRKRRSENPVVKGQCSFPTADRPLKLLETLH